MDTSSNSLSTNNQDSIKQFDIRANSSDIEIEILLKAKKESSMEGNLDELVKKL